MACLSSIFYWYPLRHPLDSNYLADSRIGAIKDDFITVSNIDIYSVNSGIV